MYYAFDKGTELQPIDKDANYLSAVVHLYGFDMFVRQTRLENNVVISQDWCFLQKRHLAAVGGHRCIERLRLGSDILLRNVSGHTDHITITVTLGTLFGTVSA
jgi:hypothetical protein